MSVQDISAMCQLIGLALIIALVIGASLLVVSIRVFRRIKGGRNG